jgi:hypothetical protein
MANCKAPSHDYQDGGAVEWWTSGETIQDSYVHHNWAIGNEGFLEVGSHNGTVRDTVLAYNVSVNNGWLGFFNLDGTFATRVENFRIENNTIIQELPHAWVTKILNLNADLTPDTLLMRNNIFYVDGWDISSRSGFTHDHNLYYLGGGGELGFTLGQGEKIADPLFVSLNRIDFRLQPDSPAIDSGVDLGHLLDFSDHPVPIGAAPDMGAFEYRILIWLPLILRH